ncbi:MAG: quinone oxidoreductase [Planctomycetota bacterium]
MQAIRVHAAGGVEVLCHEHVPEPRLEAGQALVRIEAVGVNFIDIYQRTGQYPIPLPATLGQEAAGVVAAVAADVTSVRVGERVAYAGVLGAYATLAAVPAARLVRVPAAISSRQAAAVMLQGMTAHYLACSTHPLKLGDTCLVHAGAGGVGLLLCQVARMRGARVIATVSSDAKAARARAAGAGHTIDYTRQDFAVEVKRLTDGKGVDVVYDSVGKATFDRSLDVLCRRGMLVLFGQSRARRTARPAGAGAEGPARAHAPDPVPLHRRSRRARGAPASCSTGWQRRRWWASTGAAAGRGSLAHAALGGAARPPAWRCLVPLSVSGANRAEVAWWWRGSNVSRGRPRRSCLRCATSAMPSRM